MEVRGRALCALLVAMLSYPRASIFAEDPKPISFDGADSRSENAFRIKFKLHATDPAPERPSDCSETGPLNADQERRFFGLTNTFEYSDWRPDYGTMKPMKEGDGDGRGYCTGIIGFCSNTDDLADVIDEYTTMRPDNRLKSFVARMRELSRKASHSILGLEGLSKAWNASTNDPFLQKAQRTIRDRDYLAPAMAIADRLGVKTALGRAILYDSVVQHGEGGFSELVERLRKTTPATPISGAVSERDWLLAFLEVRHAELAHAGDPATRAVWLESRQRTDVLANLIKDGYWGFCSRLKLRSPHDWNGEEVP